MGDTEEETSCNSEDDILQDTEDQANAQNSNAVTKRKSFASQKPLARISLMKTNSKYFSFDKGHGSSSERSDSQEDSLQTSPLIINRRAAFKKISNITRGIIAIIPEDKRIRRFARIDSFDDVPGNFSPRNSLKRQRSISADSLAEIRDLHSPNWMPHEQNTTFNAAINMHGDNKQSTVNNTRGSKEEARHRFILASNASVSSPELDAVNEYFFADDLDSRGMASHGSNSRPGYCKKVERLVGCCVGAGDNETQKCQDYDLCSPLEDRNETSTIEGDILDLDKKIGNIDCHYNEMDREKRRINYNSAVVKPDVFKWEGSLENEGMCIK